MAAVFVGALAATVAVPISAVAAMRPVISSAGFGMHYLGLGDHPYPALPFGSARIWDMGVTWADLQPHPPTARVSTVTGDALPVDPVPAGFSRAAVARLDGIVKTYVKRHVAPVLTLGVTPAWAARQCNYTTNGQDWGIRTCAPRDTGATGPWARYVRFLANRYRGQIRYFETWNEPSLQGSYNDSPVTLAAMQRTAYRILRRYGDRLISPGVPFTNGDVKNGVTWLRQFLQAPGGKSFDIVGLHLYATDRATRAGVAPEWSIGTALPAARQVLKTFHLEQRPIWNTEYNIGRVIRRTGYQGTATGAAMIARYYVLANEAGVARTFWYAVDDRKWGGTWLENSGLNGVTTAGRGYRSVARLLLGTVPLGCRKPRAHRMGTYTCRFGTSTGHPTLIVAWTTGRRHRVRAPAGTIARVTVTGRRSRAYAGCRVTVSSTPVYLIGTF